MPWWGEAHQEIRGGSEVQADPGVGVNTSFTFEVILLDYYIILLFLSYAIFVNIYNITWVLS